MKPDGPSAESGQAESEGPRPRPVSLGAALRQAWVGYHRRLDEAMAASGFDDRGFPDGRVLRVCAASADVTSSQLGRELGITRQGAAKVVAKLRDRHYVEVSDSTVSGREKIVTLTPRARAYLAAHRAAARDIERQLRQELGGDRLRRPAPGAGGAGRRRPASAARLPPPSHRPGCLRRPRGLTESPRTNRKPRGLVPAVREL